MESNQMAISIADLGFRQAVTAVERLRTYDGRVFQVAAHLRRWKQTIAALRIRGLPSQTRIQELIEELVRRNRAALDQWGDFGVTLFATPGITGTNAPTLGLHLNRLDLERVSRRQKHGQPLIVTEICQPPNNSWPRSIKVRCRIHYYLADQIAHSQNADSVGVLIDQDGTITETSIANLAIVESGGIISPLADRVLPGITQAVTEDLATAVRLTWRRDSIGIERLENASEVILMGTDTGIWFANRVNDRPINDGKPGPIYQNLCDAFKQLTLAL
jgi:branched-subunit amino acid aminotransferase/4-amino-4-deoxychorismate lyase